MRVPSLRATWQPVRPPGGDAPGLLEAPAVGDGRHGPGGPEAVGLERRRAALHRGGELGRAHRRRGGPHGGGVLQPVAADVLDGGAVEAVPPGEAGRLVGRRGRRAGALREGVADERVAVGRVPHQPGVLPLAVPVGVGDAQRLRRRAVDPGDEPGPAQPRRDRGPGARVPPGERGRRGHGGGALLLHDEVGVGGGGRRDRGGVQAQAAADVDHEPRRRVRDDPVPRVGVGVVAAPVARLGQGRADEVGEDAGRPARGVQEQRRIGRRRAGVDDQVGQLLGQPGGVGHGDALDDGEGDGGDHHQRGGDAGADHGGRRAERARHPLAEVGGDAHVGEELADGPADGRRGEERGRSRARRRCPRRCRRRSGASGPPARTARSSAASSWRRPAPTGRTGRTWGRGGAEGS